MASLPLPDAQDGVAGRLQEVLDEFKHVLPLVEELANPALQQRHWAQLLGVLGAQVPPNEDGSGEYRGPTGALSANPRFVGPCLPLKQVELCFPAGSDAGPCIPSTSPPSPTQHAALCPSPAGFEPFSLRELVSLNPMDKLEQLQVCKGVLPLLLTGFSCLLTDWQPLQPF